MRQRIFEKDQTADKKIEATVSCKAEFVIARESKFRSGSTINLFFVKMSPPFFGELMMDSNNALQAALYKSSFDLYQETDSGLEKESFASAVRGGAKLLGRLGSKGGRTIGKMTSPGSTASRAGAKTFSKSEDLGRWATRSADNAAARAPRTTKTIGRSSQQSSRAAQSAGRRSDKIDEAWGSEWGSAANQSRQKWQDFRGNAASRWGDDTGRWQQTYKQTTPNRFGRGASGRQQWPTTVSRGAYEKKRRSLTGKAGKAAWNFGVPLGSAGVALESKLNEAQRYREAVSHGSARTLNEFRNNPLYALGLPFVNDEYLQKRLRDQDLPAVADAYGQLRQVSQRGLSESDYNKAMDSFDRNSYIRSAIPFRNAY